MTFATRTEATLARRRERGRNVAYSLFFISGLVERLLSEQLAPTGLTADDLGLLSAIGGGKGVTPTELATELGTPRATLTTRIRGLVERRYVRRIANPADRRSYWLELTPKGRAAWKSAVPALRATLERIEEELRLDIDDVEETLVELERALRAALAGVVENGRAIDAIVP